jgi:hypothetical protein
MPSYPVKAWDGSQWVDIAAQPADLSDYAPLNSPTFTGNTVLPSTTSIGNVSSTEIGHLDGVTSGVQAQLNAKAPINSPTFTGTVVAPTVFSESGSVTLSSGTTGSLFTMAGNAAYIVYAFVAADDAPNYNEVAFCTSQGAGSGTIAVVVNAAILNISLSGATVRGVQNSGISATIQWRALRIA